MPVVLSEAIHVQLIKRRATALNAAAKHARDDLATFRARSEQHIIDGERHKPQLSWPKRDKAAGSSDHGG